jgi:hypothetical protein
MAYQRNIKRHRNIIIMASASWHHGENGVSSRNVGGNGGVVASGEMA